VSSTKEGLPSEARSAKAGVAQSTAQAELRRAIELVARGQTTEATRLLADALSQRADWSDARATLAALQAEAGDRRQALATLLDGVRFDPTRFAPTAAQLQAELNDPAGALLALDRVPPAARDQSYHALAAAIAQRAGRHQMAVAEYGAASGPCRPMRWPGSAWACRCRPWDTMPRRLQPTAAPPAKRSAPSCVASCSCGSAPCRPARRPKRRGRFPGTQSAPLAAWGAEQVALGLRAAGAPRHFELLFGLDALGTTRAPKWRPSAVTERRIAIAAVSLVRLRMKPPSMFSPSAGKSRSSVRLQEPVPN